MIQRDINGIALDLREAHKEDFFSVPEDNPLEDFLQTIKETAKEESDPEQAAQTEFEEAVRKDYAEEPNARRRYDPRQSHNAVLLLAARFHGLHAVSCKLT